MALSLSLVFTLPGQGQGTSAANMTVPYDGVTALSQASLVNPFPAVHATPCGNKGLAGDINDGHIQTMMGYHDAEQKTRKQNNGRK